MAAPRFARVVLASLALGAPFLVVAHVASGLVAPLTRTAVTLLARVTAPLTPSPVIDVPESETAELLPAEPAVLAVDAAAKAPVRHTAKPQPKSAPAALFVSEAQVLKLAQSSARPRGNFVAATPDHPAGLRLTGVAALGIGVQDGDILIEALGITPRAPGQVIGAIIEARAKQARFLSGTLWRQGKTFAITVEQPYLPARTPS